MRLLLLLAVVFALFDVALAQEIAPEDRRSGTLFMSGSSRDLQADDSANPAMLFARDGEDFWQAEGGAAQKSCAGCHGNAAVSMRGVAARYPAFDAASGRPVTLAQRLNLCRQNHQQALALAPESSELLGLSAFIGLQSRGLPIAPPDDPRLVPFRASGRALYTARQGQLNLSCADCHVANWDRKLGGAPVTQGQANGYPLYRLEWQSMGSLERRIRNCMTGVRAEPFAPSSAQMVDLQVYLADRARGLSVETPAVRP